MTARERPDRSRELEPASPRAGNARKRETPWRPPTRRAFVAILGATAAALAAKNRAGLVRALGRGDTSEADGASDDDRPRSPWTGTTRWIGHC